MSSNREKVVTSPFNDVCIQSSDLWKLISGGNRFSSKIAVVDGKSGLCLTYRELYTEAENIARNLMITAGFSCNRPVMIYMRTCIDFILISLAVWRLGGTVVYINPLSVKDELLHKLKLVPCDIIFCDESNASCALSVKDGVPGVKKIFCRQDYLGTESLTELRRESSKVTSKIPCKVNPDTDIALIVFSSGTTGLPKAVTITHSALVGQTVLWGGPEMENLPSECSVLFLPFSHVFGATLMIIHLAMATKMVVMEGFNLEEYLRLVSLHKSDQLFLVPPVAVLICKSDLVTRYDLSSVTNISIGGATLREETERHLHNVFRHKVQIRQLYGLTEAAGGCIGVPKRHPRVTLYPQGTVGVPFPNMAAKVVDVRTGNDLGVNTTGEVCVKSQYFMSGYLKDPAATMATIDASGWLHTGDIGYYDNEGFFFIVDRLKDVIKYKGYQIAPAELEAVLLSHPDITDAGVTGIPDPTAGEVPYAWVVTRQGSEVSESDLHVFLRGKVSPYKKIKGGIRFVENIPKSSSGKILRREIRSDWLRTESAVKSKL